MIPYVTFTNISRLCVAGADCFVEPHMFIPERWTTRRSELVLHAGASNPFGTGELSQC